VTYIHPQVHIVTNLKGHNKAQNIRNIPIVR